MANHQGPEHIGHDDRHRCDNSGLAGSQRGGEGAAIIGGATRAERGPGPRVMSASTLEGDDIMNRQGEKLASSTK